MTDPPHDPLLDALRAANPVPDPAAIITPSSHSDLFQEITMTDPTINTSTGTDPSSAAAADRGFGSAPSRDELAPRRKTRSRAAFAGAAAATAAVVGFGALTLAPGSTTAAQAAMVAAATSTEAMDSGVAVVTINSSESDLDEFVVTTSFSGADLQAMLDGNTTGFDLGGNPEVRLVDGTIYLSLGEGGWYSVTDPTIIDLVSTSGLPVDIRSDLSKGIVELVKSADDVEEVEPGHFTATVTVEEARLLAKSFPTLGLYTDKAIDDSELPADVADQVINIDLRLDDAGLIDVVTLGGSAVDPDTNDSVTGSIEIDINDLGTPQSIEAPADAQEFDISALLGND